MVSREDLERLTVDVFDVAAHLGRIALDKMARQQGNVLPPFPKRWDFDPCHVDPVVEVLAEARLADLLAEVSGRGGYHADVDGQLFPAADAPDAALLQDA